MPAIEADSGGLSGTDEGMDTLVEETSGLGLETPGLLGTRGREEHTRIYLKEVH